MREVSTKKRTKVLKLYFEGRPYDEIARCVGVSKGSVFNVIDELREGLFAGFEELSYQVDFLRELAVAFRKLDISPWQAQAGASLFERLLRLGVEPADLERWIQLCRDIASPDHSVESFTAAALELSALEEEKGIDYEAILEEYEAKLLHLQELASGIEELKAQRAAEKAEHEAEMERRRDELKAMRGTVRELHKGYAEQRRKLEEELSDHLNKHGLTLEQVELVALLAGQELSRSGLGQEAIDHLIEQVGEAGSLSTLHSQLKDECSLVTANRAWLQATDEALGRGCSELWEEVQTLLARRDGLEGNSQKLASDIAYAQEALEQLRQERDKLRDDIELAKAVVRLLANPYLLTQGDFYILLRAMGSFWQTMMQVKSTVGQIYYKEEIADGLKRRIAELLMPSVEDQFVPKWCYEASEKRFDEVKEELENLKAARRETAT